MLKFICDYCSTEYKTEGVLGVDSRMFKVVYEYENQRKVLTDASMPCYRCEELAEKAKTDALKALKDKKA